MSQSPLSPEFQKAYNNYIRLKQAHQANQIETTVFLKEIDKLLIQDQLGQNWRIDENGQWFFYDGHRWIRKDPGKKPLKSLQVASEPSKKKKPWLKIALPIIVIFICVCLVIALTSGWYLQMRTNFLDILWATKISQIDEDTLSPTIFSTPSTPIAIPVLEATPGDIPPEVLQSEQQKLIFSEFGWPDAFTIMEIDNTIGNSIRLETWIYNQGLISFTFADGNFLVEGEVERFPQGTINTPYNPSQFPLGASTSQIQTTLVNYPLVPIENTEVIREGVQLYACEQLLLGFLYDHLFYVDAMAFVPEGGE